MTLARLLYLLGFLLIIYAVISGLNIQYTSNALESTFKSSYSFKIGTFVVGCVLLFLGRKSKK